jgi:hypothetical protein
VRFYSSLFAAVPAVLESDYAKWMLDNPRVNYAISQGHGSIGIQHLGIEVEDGDELAEVYDRLKAADAPVLEEGATVCCYAQSQKSWISDPQGLAWETFLTHGENTVYGGNGPATGAPIDVAKQATGCCTAAVTAKPATTSCRSAAG